MEDACPLRAVRDGAWQDDAFATGYRRQAVELGWYSMLVPESLGGGNVSGNGVLDAALIAYERGEHLQPGSFVGTNVVAFTLAQAGSDELRQTVLAALLSGEASASWAAASLGDGHRTGDVDARPAGAGGYELSGVTSPVQDVEASSWLLVGAATADGPVQVLV